MATKSLTFLKNSNRDFNNVLDSYVNLQDGGNTMTQPIKGNYMRFLTGEYSGLSLLIKTDANCDSGFTASLNTVHDCAALGDAVNLFVLPSATKDAVVIFRINAQCDGGQNLVFQCNNTDNYIGETLVNNTIGDSPLSPGVRVFGTDFTPTQGTKITTMLATDNVLTISATATNNQTHIGSEVGFYCETAGSWRIMFKGSALGSGVMNATFSGSRDTNFD